MALKRRQKIWLFSGLAVLLVSICIYFFGFYIILWLTTPGDGALRPAEKQFIDSLKITYKDCKHIWRDPKYGMNNTADTTGYALSFEFAHRSNAAQEEDKRNDSLRQIAYGIARHAYLKVMKKDPKFVQYSVAFYYEDDARTYFYDFRPDSLR